MLNIDTIYFYLYLIALIIALETNPDQYEDITMNQRAAYFEISSVIFLLFLGLTLSTLGIESTGILSVAALLSLSFAAGHFKALVGMAIPTSLKPSWLTTPSSNVTES